MRANSMPVAVVRNARRSGSRAAGRRRGPWAHAQPAEDLHGARGDMVAFHTRGFAATRCSTTITSKPRQARSIASVSDRAGTDDQDAALRGDLHPGGQMTLTRACWPARTAAAARCSAAGRSAGPLDAFAVAAMRRDDVLEGGAGEIGTGAIVLARRRYSIHVQRRPPHRAVERVVVDDGQHRQVLLSAT